MSREKPIRKRTSCGERFQFSVENVYRDRGTGYEISAAYLDGEQIVVRLFNADGDGTPQKIRFAFPLSKVEQTDLNGNATAACAIRKRGGVSEIEVAMPRFGLKTLRLTK